MVFLRLKNTKSVRRVESKVTGNPRSLVLSMVAFISNLILGIFSIAIPIYAYVLGATPFEIGLVGSSVAFVYSFAPFIMGGLSDKIGQTKSMVLALSSIAALSLSYTMISDPIVLAFLRIFEGVSWAMLWPAIEAGTASLGGDLEEDLRRYNISWSSGATVGPPIAGFAMAVLNVSSVFYISSFMALLACLSVLFFMRGSRGKNVKGEKIDFKAALLTLKSYTSLHLPLTSSFFYSFIVSIVFTFFPPYAVYIGLSALEVGFLAFLSGVARTLSFFFAKYVHRRFGENLPIRFSTPLLGFSSILIYFGLPALHYLAFITIGVLVGLTYSSSLLTIMRKAKSKTGLYAGMFESAIGFGYMTGPLVGGLISGYRRNYPFLLCGFAGLTILIVQAALRKTLGGSREPRSTRRP
ncbi:hypothetical protein CP083_02400 [Candidatus Bathyarchaeota archaeon B24-2]|nr:MAG: hypothetical protein CP083_02400 [Candidatus Bathyarchaeota archaeon B24-2]